MIRSKFWLSLLAVTSLLGLTASAQALNLELTQGVDNAIPVAIYAFSPKVIDGAKVQISSVISNDLTMSGRFAVTPMAYDANANMMSNAQLQQWQQANITDVVLGSIQKEITGNYAVTAQLMDVPTHAVLWTHTYHISLNQFRVTAHKISNQIFQRLTGIPGIFTTKIAYIHVLGHAPGAKQYRLEVADMDGFDPHVLAVSSAPIMSPAWSPDGKQIAYVSYEHHKSAIYIQNLNDGSRIKISDNPGINASPSFSPDGQSLVMVQTINGYPHIALQNINSGKTQVLTKGYYFDTEPSFSPDGQSIIFTSTRNSGYQLYALNLQTLNITRLTFNGNYNVNGSYFPDGNNFVMLHQTNHMMSIAKQTINSLNAPTILDADESDASPSIAPNGGMVVYSKNYQGHRILALVSTDGQAKSRLPATVGDVEDPAWSPFFKNNKW